MGAGLLAGSQLSPRAATNWEQVRLAPSPALPGNLSIWVIGALGTATLALAAVAGGALFMLWALGLVRKLTSFPLRGKAWRRASVWLAAAVLAVPMGSWFAVCRLAADSVDGPRGAAISDLLQGRALLTALAVTVAGAVVPLCVMTLRPRTTTAQPPERPRQVRRAPDALDRARREALPRPAARLWGAPLAALAWCATAALVPLAVWGAGAAVRHAVLPAQTAIAAVGVPNGAPPQLPQWVAVGQLTTAELHDRLLTVADLAHGYQPYDLQILNANSSDRPACLAILDWLDGPAPPDGVTESRTAFAAGQEGPWILEVLRSYPRQVAAQALSTVTTDLSRCGSFTLTWTSPPAETAAESVQPHGPVNLGDLSWSATLTVASSTPVSETLILVRVKTSLLELEVASAVGLPPTAQVISMAAGATAKLAH